MRISMDVAQKNYFVLRKYYFYEKFWKKNKFSNFQKKLIRFLEIKYKIIFLGSENNIFGESLEKVSMMVQYFDTSGIWMPEKVQKWSIAAVF